VTAIPNAGYIFTSWSDGDSSNPKAIDLTEDILIKAFFTEDDYSGINLLTNKDKVRIENNVIHICSDYDNAVLFDTSGRKIAIWSNQQEFDANQFTNGCYFFIITYGSGATTKHILIKK